MDLMEVSSQLTQLKKRIDKQDNLLERIKIDLHILWALVFGVLAGKETLRMQLVENGIGLSNGGSPIWGMIFFIASILCLILVIGSIYNRWKRIGKLL